MSSADIQILHGETGDKISRFDSATGAFIDTIAPQGTGGTFTFGPDGTLY